MKQMSSSSGVAKSCQIRAKEESSEHKNSTKMARFSLGRDEDDHEEGTSTRPVPKKRRTNFAGTFSCSAAARPREEEEEEVVEEEEEEEEEEQEEEEEEEEEEESESESDREFDVSCCARVSDTGKDLEGSSGNGSISVVLSDPDVLDCPICLESLSIPVFQCENGHIACSSCCPKVANKCPSCSWPIGYNRCRAIEKVLESVKVSCTNKRYGCKETLSYNKKTDHENACLYAPCSCPYSGCSFAGSSTKVYAHFSSKHGSSAQEIGFNSVRPIYIGKYQKYQCLQESTEGIIFIINHTSDRLGSAVNIICVGPSSQKRRFRYELLVTDESSILKLESFAENVPKWSEGLPMKKFLLVPRGVINHIGMLKLNIMVKEFTT